MILIKRSFNGMGEIKVDWKYGFKRIRVKEIEVWIEIKMLRNVV